MNSQVAVLPEVIVIPATITEKTHKTRKKKLRVAAYCRVSTDDEEQLTSYRNQIEHYTHKIKQNADWKLVGIFADEGITGVMAKKRDEFLKLINLCRDGKVDVIITKSISRFSRNVADTIKYVRELKALNVAVIFEKENVDTSKMTSEMILDMYGVFAQAESESISDNVRMGKRFGYKSGKVPMQYGQILGYRRGENNEPEIVPEEAKIIELIYYKFLEGWSLPKLSKHLEENGYKTAKGSMAWSKATIRGILTNEKYKGDVLMQKSYVVDLFSKKVAKNNGELPMYLVKNHHKPIIPREVWDKVQVVIARRNNIKSATDMNMMKKGRYSSKYALTGLVICGDCGSQYRRTTWTANGKRIVWRCVNRLTNGKDACGTSPTIDEERLHTGIVKAMNSMIDGKEKIQSLLNGSIAEILAAPDSHKEIISLKKEIDDKNEDILQMVADGVKNRESRADITAKCRDEYEKIKALQEKLNIAEINSQMEKESGGRLREIYDTISAMPGKMTEYDDNMTRIAVTEVKILSEEKISVTLFGTVTVEVEI